MPKWATPERRNILLQLLLPFWDTLVGWEADERGNAINPAYDALVKPLIENWIQDDRETASALWKIEQRHLHSFGEQTMPLRGQFSAISRQIYHDAQPVYYVEGIGFSGVTLRPFIKIRLASSYEVLHVYLDCKLTKNKRRKLVRYGKLPQRAIELVNSAVRDARR